MLGGLLILCTLGCTHLKDRQEVNKLTWLESEDVSPEADLKTALENQDCRFSGVYGFTLDIPGVNESPSERFKLREEYGVNPIDGTSDNLINERHIRRIALAKEYARTYNRLKMQKINAGAPCKTSNN